MHANCKDNYRPMVISFVQCQHVQLFLKKIDTNTKLRATSGAMNINQQSSPVCHRRHKEIHYDIGKVDRLNSVQKTTDLKQNQKWK